MLVAIEPTFALAQDEEVVAVQVDRMRQDEVVLDDPVRPDIGVWDLDNVVLGLPLVVALVDVFEDGMVPLDLDVHVVDFPSEHFAAEVDDGLLEIDAELAGVEVVGVEVPLEVRHEVLLVLTRRCEGHALVRRQRVVVGTFV